MTVPNGPAGINATGWPAIISAAGHSPTNVAGLKGLDQPTVEALFKDKFVGTSGSGLSVFTSDTGPLAEVWSGLRRAPGFSIFGALLEALLQRVFGTSQTWADLPSLLTDAESFWGRFQSFLGGIDFTATDFNLSTALQQFVNTSIKPLNLLLGPDSKIGAWQLPPIHIGRLTSGPPDLVMDGGFDAVPMGEPGRWRHNPDVGRTKPGCTEIVGDGAAADMVGIPVEVAAGQKFRPSVWVSWEGAAGSAGSVRLTLVEFAAQVPVNTVVIGGVTPSGTSSWVELANDYTVPPGVDMVAMAPSVTAGFASGTARFDDATGPSTGLLEMGWTRNLTQRWGQLGSLLNIADTDLDGTIGVDDVWRSWLANRINPLAATTPGLLDLSVVGGDSGLADMVGTLQALRDRIFPGGSGRSLADLANAGTNVAQSAADATTVANDAAAVLAIRNNQAAFEAIDPTAQSTVPNSTFGSPLYTFAVTRTTAAGAFIRINADKTIGTINWVGYGNTSIAAAYLTAWKVDQVNGTRTKVYQSGDVSSLMSAGATPAWCNHDILEADRFDVLAGEAYVIELKVTGTGTHTVVGAANATPEQTRTNVWPSKNGEVRDSNAGDTGTTSPTTILDSAVTYSNNVIGFEVGIADGDIQPPVYVPRTFSFESSGTFDIPSWAKYLDRICKGAGQGGGAGIGFSSGPGGDDGDWAADTLEVGVDIPAGTTTLAVSVGVGGAPGPYSVIDAGSPGGDSSVSGTGVATLTAAGGSGGNVPNVNGSGGVDFTYRGVVYVAGDPTAGPPPSVPGQNGNAPGGGGQGGRATGAGAGGYGARGQVWIVARVNGV